MSGARSERRDVQCIEHRMRTSEAMRPICICNGLNGVMERSCALERRLGLVVLYMYKEGIQSYEQIVEGKFHVEPCVCRL